MSRAVNKGWDFVKVGNTYQYKEDGWLAMVKVLEDNSTESDYHFKLQVEKSSVELSNDQTIFDISHSKLIGGYYSGMLQIYETEEYSCNYVWERQVENNLN